MAEANPASLGGMTLQDWNEFLEVPDDPTPQSAAVGVIASQDCHNFHPYNQENGDLMGALATPSSYNFQQNQGNSGFMVALDTPNSFNFPSDQGNCELMELEPSQSLQLSELENQNLLSSGQAQSSITPMQPVVMENISTGIPAQSQVNNITSTSGHVQQYHMRPQFTYVSDQLKLHRKLMEDWQLNEMEKERTLKVVPAFYTNFWLKSVQIFNNWICKYFHLLSIEEQESTRNFLSHNLLVVTAQPHSSNGNRITTKGTNSNATVRILLDKKWFISNRIVRATIFDHEGHPATVASSESDNLPQFTAELIEEDTEDAFNLCYANFSFIIDNNPTRPLKALYPKTMRTSSDANFWIKFELELKVRGSSKPIFAHTMSLPMKILVHTTQVHAGLETIIWDPPAGVFQIQHVSERPLELSYTSVIESINTRFKNITGRGLSTYDFRIIFTKFFGPNFFERAADLSEIMMSLAEFRCPRTITWRERGQNDDVITKTSRLSLWDWVYALETFITKFLQFEVNEEVVNVNGSDTNNKIIYSLWKNRKIIGYIPLQTSYSTLNLCDVGTFLIRFPNGTPDAISIDFKGAGEKLYSIRLSQDLLENRSLPERILDIPELRYLYTRNPADNGRFGGVPKADIFRSLANGPEYQDDYLPFQLFDNDMSVLNHSHELARYVRAIDVRSTFLQYN